MHHIIYKTTNKINGHIYIGMHSTKNLDDGYMGSGKILKQAILKYGLENFEREVLFDFQTADEMKLKEQELVTEEFCSREDVYNLCPGGKGGFGYLNASGLSSRLGTTVSEETRKKIAETLRGRSLSSDHKERLRIAMANREINWRDKLKKPRGKMSDEWKNKISESLKGKPRVKVVCPHCGVEGDECIMKRWHFEKCKNADVV